MIIEIEEVTRATLEEVGGAPQGKLVVADGKSAGGKGVYLAGSGVELELVVGYDGTNAALCVGENTVFQGSHKASIRTALREVKLGRFVAVWCGLQTWARLLILGVSGVDPVTTLIWKLSSKLGWQPAEGACGDATPFTLVVRVAAARAAAANE